MTRVVYVNGHYKPYFEAAVHVEDRGYQFADGVYEVCEILNGRLVDERRHIARLNRSMAELDMLPLANTRSLGVILRETVRRNRVKNGIVYLQVTRGVAKRDFAFPPLSVGPSIICLARSMSRFKNEKKAANGVSVITIPDIRWQRVDIKTTSLLAQSMARQQAKNAGADEAWMVDRDGHVTEGASCNAWIVTQDGVLVTRPADSGILRGITREVAMQTAQTLQMRYEERSFTVEEAISAKEAFQTSASGLVMPVIKINGKLIGDGRAGKAALTLRSHYHNVAEISELSQLLK